MGKQKVVLAFSGGLDTSFCVKYLSEDKGYDVYTAIANTGGFSKEELANIEKRALALGAALGTIAVIVRQEIVLFIMGGVFVMETLSVVIQVASFKLTGRRVFRMAPIHHHFELKGWPEPRVIVRFWIITVILVLIGLAIFTVASLAAGLAALLGERRQQDLDAPLPGSIT